MARLQLTHHISAPVDRVFDVFTDFAHAAENVRAIQKLELLTNGPIGVGTRFRETRTMFGRSATETLEITDFHPGRSYTVGCQSCGCECRSRFDFRPDAGGTTVALDFVYAPVTFFAKLMSPLSVFVIKSCRKAMEEELADLKAVAERNS